MLLSSVELWQAQHSRWTRVPTLSAVTCTPCCAVVNAAEEGSKLRLYRVARSIALCEADNEVQRIEEELQLLPLEMQAHLRYLRQLLAKQGEIEAALLAAQQVPTSQLDAAASNLATAGYVQLGGTGRYQPSAVQLVANNQAVSGALSYLRIAQQEVRQVLAKSTQLIGSIRDGVLLAPIDAESEDADSEDSGLPLMALMAVMVVKSGDIGLPLRQAGHLVLGAGGGACSFNVAAGSAPAAMAQQQQQQQGAPGVPSVAAAGAGGGAFSFGNAAGSAPAAMAQQQQQQQQQQHRGADIVRSAADLAIPAQQLTDQLKAQGFDVVPLEGMTVVAMETLAAAQIVYKREVALRYQQHFPGVVIDTGPALLALSADAAPKT
ncbi:hypothetical protein COO60DRAFT_1668684 [Scenedesmus sp. NREL 46B-D3]|nr:hypothetical protein COO60DRAFT_1668684 [Scenedesmus sp. NREL 46B-D3]